MCLRRGEWRSHLWKLIQSPPIASVGKVWTLFLQLHAGFSCWLELVLVAVFVTKNSEYWLFFYWPLLLMDSFTLFSSFWLIACSASTSVRILSLFYLVWIWGLIEVRICAWIMHNKISAVHMGVCCWLFLFLPWITGKVQSDRLKLVIGNRKIAT